MERLRWDGAQADGVLWAMNRSLFIDEAGPFFEAPKADESDSAIIVLASLLIPTRAVDGLERMFDGVKASLSLPPTFELKSSFYLMARAGWTSVPKGTAEIQALPLASVETAYRTLCEYIAGIEGALTACVRANHRAAYDPNWLKRTQDAVVGGYVRPWRVYVLCYQELLQRAEKDHGTAGDSIAVYVDYHDRIDEKVEEGWRRLHDIHGRLTRRRPVFSWGEPLDDVADFVAVSPSHRYVGLQAVDLVTGAFFAWLRGKFPPAFASLSGIVRRPGGRLRQRGIICVPKTTAQSLSEEDCADVLSKAANPPAAL